MENTKLKILKEYDEYLSTLKHVSSLSIQKDLYKESNKGILYTDVEKFVTEEMSEIHKKRINGIVNKLLSNDVGLDMVRDMKTFIAYPDFKVKTYIDNVANIFNHNMSLEKCLLICPSYELNLVNKNDGTSLAIKRLEISPYVNIFTISKEKIDLITLNKCIDVLSDKFYKKYKTKPSMNDLILMKNYLLKYMIENNKKDVVSDETKEIISYDYLKTKKEICEEYKVSWKDYFNSVTFEESPWINDGLLYFDNRGTIKTEKSLKIIPLEYQRTKK